MCLRCSLYNFSLNPTTFGLVAALPGGHAYPKSVSVALNDRLFAVTGSATLGDALLIYDPSGNLLFTQDVCGTIANELDVSGDGLLGVTLNPLYTTIVPVGP